MPPLHKLSGVGSDDGEQLNQSPTQVAVGWNEPGVTLQRSKSCATQHKMPNPVSHPAMAPL
jgi:hypothetical protein